MKTKITFLGLLALCGFTLLGFRNLESKSTYIDLSKNPLKKHPFITATKTSSCTQCHDCQPPTSDSISINSQINRKNNTVLSISEKPAISTEYDAKQNAEPLKSN